MAATAARSPDPRFTFIEELDWFWRRFVHPPGYGKASDLLETHRTVLLSGEAGSGRVATAKALLRGLSTGDELFHELTWEWDKEIGRYRLEPAAVGDDDRVWLNLAQADERVWRAFQEELSSVRKMIVGHSALLVVVLPSKGGEGLWPEFTRFHAAIGRPVAHEVLRRYLRLAGVPGAATGPLPGFLRTNRPLRDVARFAYLVDLAHQKNPGNDYAAWYKAAETAYTGHGAEVAERIAKLRLGPQRALFLAAAMLQDAHVDHVYNAAMTLLSTVSYADECHSLERSDLVESLKGIGAELDDRGHVRFEELGYDAAVRAHFWHHMPGLRDGIRQWVGKMIDRTDLPDKDRDLLVTRFAGQCLHPRYRHVLVDAVAEWTKGPMTYRRQMAAHKALQRALNTEEHGGFFRKQIYNWATDDHLSEALSQVVIVMCAKVIALSHPDQAIVRLHHRARRENRTSDARTALLELVSGDPWFRRQLLLRLTQSLEGNRKEYEKDPDLFLDLADPAAFTAPGHHGRPLAANAEVRTMLTDGWRRVFHERDETIWQARMRQWLAVAHHDDRHRDVLVDVLVSGGEQRSAILGRLYTEARAVSRSAENGADHSAAFLDVVLRKISTSQGIQIP
ncbi:hypothetical protein [Nonomuraea sp. NEAU-A123]|uniref:hypothetical protein n=1 Tax=Nonomuraea sp. NEAU-A123 TaxID=2839649 RepID=UPI001BE48D35|nr:hypothetical protein [Nonomuraea sp. NEAU-A123]MBT2232302.1 hypothetical protein [Nonomuraea sp. NEAU-A123]